MRRAAILVTAGVVSALAVTTMAGCGGSSGALDDEPVPSSSVHTYTNPEYGFSFQYAPPFEKIADTEHGSGTTGQREASAAVFDTSGTKIRGIYRDAFAVNVYRTEDTFDTDQQAKAELSSTTLPLLKQQTPGLETGAVTETEVGDRKAYAVDAKVTVDETPLLLRMYFLFDGHIEYQILTQAAAGNWETLQPDFDAMLDSFETGPANPSPRASA